jgi:cytochrome P450
MGYAGTCLTKAEWLKSIRDSASDAIRLAAAGANSKAQHQSEEEIVAHLVTLVQAGQKAYAWWAAHLYAEILGSRGQRIPEKLTVAMEAISQKGDGD